MSKENMLIKFNHAFMSYKDFLSNKVNEELYENNNIETLLILFSILKIILNKDKINTKDENEEEYIDDIILEQIITMICKIKNNKYYLGNISFDSKEEILKTLRNKIAHGEFTIGDNSEHLILSLDDEDVYIDRKSLISLSINLIDRLSLYTNSKVYERTQTYASIKRIKKIKRAKDIDKFLSSIYSLELTFTNVSPIEKDKIEQVLKKLPQLSTNYEAITNKDIDISFINSVFASHGLEVTTKLTPLSETVYYDILSDMLYENIKSLKQLELQEQIVLVSNWYHKVKNDTNQLENLSTGIHYNMLTLFSLLDKRYKNIEEAMSEIESNSLFSSMIEMILSNNLLGFYIHYQYPLENIFKSKANTSEDEVYFDYRKLDLSMLKPDVFELPEGRQSSYKSAVTASNRRLQIIDAEMNRLERQLTNIKRLLSSNPSFEEKANYEKALSTISDKISKVVTKQEQETTSLIDFQTKLEELDISDANSYYYNRYLIEYIRNAISHGHIFFYYGETNTLLSNSQIRFINTKDESILLDLTVSLDEFEQLFSNNNVSILDEFLKEKKSKK